MQSSQHETPEAVHKSTYHTPPELCSLEARGTHVQQAKPAYK